MVITGSLGLTLSLLWAHSLVMRARNTIQHKIGNKITQPTGWGQAMVKKRAVMTKRGVNEAMLGGQAIGKKVMCFGGQFWGERNNDSRRWGMKSTENENHIVYSYPIS